MKYEAVNGQWPETIPALTGSEAISAAKRLYRFGMKRGWRGKWALTSGRRYTWPRGGTFYVNPHRENRSEAKAGWPDLVHMMSHYCHQKLYPKFGAHDGRHHFLEKEMVAYAIRSGWLEGKLRKEPKPKVAPDRLAKTEAAAKRWTTKLRRAQTALRKIARQRARLARQMPTMA